MIQKTQPFTQEQLDWISNNIYLFSHATGPTKPQREKVYEIYNHLYLDNKKANGCGRCYHNTKTLVYHEYLKQSLHK